MMSRIERKIRKLGYRLKRKKNLELFEPFISEITGKTVFKSIAYSTCADKEKQELILFEWLKDLEKLSIK